MEKTSSTSSAPSGDRRITRKNPCLEVRCRTFFSSPSKTTNGGVSCSSSLSIHFISASCSVPIRSLSWCSCHSLNGVWNKKRQVVNKRTESSTTTSEEQNREKFGILLATYGTDTEMGGGVGEWGKKTHVRKQATSRKPLGGVADISFSPRDSRPE